MGNASSRNIPALPKEAVDQQFSFLNALNYDIVTQIISYLTQQDCLACMAVCRDWYHKIPQHSQTIWREIELVRKDVPVNHLRRQQCLGSHVKRVVILYVHSDKKRGSLTTLMQRLVDWKCTNIEYLELRGCVSKNQNVFLHLLKQLGSCLTQLKLSGHYRSLPMKPILEACPALTHLFYTHSYRINKDAPVDQQLTKSLPVPFVNITHLYLNIDIYIKEQLENILKRCPELRCYIGVTCTSSPPVVIDLESLLSWCPKVNYLVNSISEGLYGLNDFPETDDKTGLLYLITVDLVGVDQLTRCLQKNRHTLKHLICPKPNIDFNWTPILGSLSLPNLSLLNLETIDCNTATLIDFLNRCPLLETLDITCRLTETIDTSDFGLLHKMQCLRRLCLTCKTNSSLCMATVLERFPALESLTLSGYTLVCQTPFECSPRLKELLLNNVKWMHDDIDILERETAFANFVRQLTYQTSMELVHIDKIDFTIGFEALITIATIPTLKSLNLQYNRKLENGEVEEFFRMLSNTKIETIDFRSILSLSFDVCITLAALPLLKSFCVSTMFLPFQGYAEISKDGLHHLLCTSPNLEIFDFDYCKVLDDSNVMSKSQVKAFIQEQAPKYRLVNSYPEYERLFNISAKAEDSEWIGSVIIKRL